MDDDVRAEASAGDGGVAGSNASDHAAEADHERGADHAPDAGHEVDGGHEVDEGHASDGGEVRPIPPLGRAIAVYSLIRIGLIVALTVILEFAGKAFGMPLIVAFAFAVVLQLPIAVLLFSRQRHDLTAALARAKSRRTAVRDQLRTELTGHEPLD